MSNGKRQIQRTSRWMISAAKKPKGQLIIFKKGKDKVWESECQMTKDKLRKKIG